MIRIYILLLLLLVGGRIKAQTMYGTIGFLHAPTAEIQRNKTGLFGGTNSILADLINIKRWQRLYRCVFQAALKLFYFTIQKSKHI